MMFGGPFGVGRGVGNTPKKVILGGVLGGFLGGFLGGGPILPSQKHPPPLPANLPLEQDMAKTPGLEHPQRYSSGGPVTLIIRVHGKFP